MKTFNKNQNIFYGDFKLENLDFYFNKIIDTFKKNFESFDYTEYNHSPLISEFDHSVRFIGSTTNVFKKYLLEKSKIPNNGYFLIQECLRTNNLKTFFIDSIFPEWASYFIMLGTISEPEKLNCLLDNTLNFLFNLGIKKDRIRISVNYKDKDLIKCVNNSRLKDIILTNIDLEKNLNLYRHKYGLDKIYGRNINIAIKNQKNGEFKDIGNIVLIENNSEKIAVEMGIGISTLIARIFDLNNSIESSSISKIIPFKSGFISKFSDTLSSSVIMLKQKINPGSRDKAGILKKYILALIYLKNKIGFNLEKIRTFTQNYEKEEFGKISDIGDRLISFIKKYEITNNNQK